MAKRVFAYRHCFLSSRHSPIYRYASHYSTSYTVHDPGQQRYMYVTTKPITTAFRVGMSPQRFWCVAGSSRRSHYWGKRNHDCSRTAHASPVASPYCSSALLASISASTGLATFSVAISSEEPASPYPTAPTAWFRGSSVFELVRRLFLLLHACSFMF